MHGLPFDTAPPNAAPRSGDAPLRLVVLTVNDMPRVWDEIEPLLERACEFSAGEMTPAGVLDGLGLWGGVYGLYMLGMEERGAIRSVMVAEVKRFPQPHGPPVLKFNILLAGGRDVDAWLPFENEMDRFAQSLGCVAVRIERARKGWTRKFPHWRRLTGDVCVMEREFT